MKRSIHTTKRAIHTTLNIDKLNWLESQALELNTAVNDVIEGLITFYKNNHQVPEENKVLKIAIHKMIEDQVNEIMSSKEVNFETDQLIKNEVKVIMDKQKQK